MMESSVTVAWEYTVLLALKIMLVAIVPADPLLVSFWGDGRLVQGLN